MVDSSVIPSPQHSSRADVVARHIEARIAEQSLPPGYHLGTKDTLRGEFSVAVATFNEAVRILSSRGAVEVRPGIGGGLFVASPTAFVRLGHKMLELSGESVPVADSLCVRDALEPLVIENAVEFARSRDIKELRKIMTEMDVVDLDATSYLRINWKLHRRMVEISPNMVLRHTYLGLLDFVSQRVHSVTALRSLADGDGVRIHTEIVDVIESGELERVPAVVREHATLAANHRETGE